MKDIVETLEYSAHLVKTWGQAKLPSGRTLAETLTLGGVPLWETVAVDLARLHVPQALSLRTSPRTLMQQVRPYLSWAKHAAIGLVMAWRSSQICPQWSPKPVLLFLGCGSYLYRDVLEPVVARLADSPDLSTVSLYNGPMSREPEWLSKSIEFQPIWQHWDDEGRARLLALRKALRTVVAELRSTKALPQIIQDEGRPLWPQMSGVFSWLFNVHLPRLLPHAVLARHILERHRPALIVTSDVTDPHARLYCLLGRQMGIPSLQTQFGAYGKDGIEWQFLVADRLAVWGEQARETMMAHGVPAEQITITGSPRHDDLVNVSHAEVAHTRVRLGIPEQCAMVLFASVYYLAEYNTLSDPELPEILNSMKRALFQAADQTPGIRLVVKPHPCENVRETRQLAGTCRNIQFVEPCDDIRELTKACDAFVSFGSTSTVDALITNKLTICPAFPGWTWNDQFLKEDLTLVPHSAKEIARCLQVVVDGSRDRILADLEPARQRFLRRWVYRVDGQASARIEALARQMAEL